MKPANTIEHIRIVHCSNWRRERTQPKETKSMCKTVRHKIDTHQTKCIASTNNKTAYVSTYIKVKRMANRLEVNVDRSN